LEQSPHSIQSTSLIQRRVDVSHQGFGELRNDGAKTGSINVTKEGP
jgi:hypothetical protein